MTTPIEHEPTELEKLEREHAKIIGEIKRMRNPAYVVLEMCF
jgi:hypothetical protein